MEIFNKNLLEIHVILVKFTKNLHEDHYLKSYLQDYT